MEKIIDDIFGELHFDLYWNSEMQINFFEKKKTIKILVDGEINEDLQIEQRQAFINFKENCDGLIKNAEDAIYEYYKEICDEYRDRFCEEADKYAPHIVEKVDMASLIEIDSVIFPWSFKADQRIFGFLLECTWEQEHGLAVKFENEQVVEVGFQDTIL